MDIKQLERALVNADRAGDTNAARILAAEITKARKSALPPLTADPTDGMTGPDLALAGMGKAVADLGRGVGQLAGVVSRPDVDESNKRDAALMKHNAAIGGNIAGNVALAVPAMFAPGANTLPGAAAIGGVMGAMQPVGEDESRVKNAVTNAALSAAVPAAVSTYRTGKALVEPFYRGGQEKIVGRTLDRFATNATDAANKLANPAALVPGTKPTVAEATLDPGLAVLQRSAQSLDPQISGAFGVREGQNTAARISSLQEIAGDAGKREFFDQSRQQAAKQLYEAAFEQVPKDTPWLKGQIKSLSERPVFRMALKEAQTLAANEGVRINPRSGKFAPEEAVKILHYTKMALDDMIGAVEGQTKKAYTDTQKKLLAVMENENFAPAYREARATYAEMSRPVNQMDVGQELLEKVRPALMDFGSETATRTLPNQYAAALRNSEQTVKNATGRNMPLDKVMTPEQMQSITGVAQDLARKAQAADLGAVRGSPTAQYLSSQNLMRQVAGPLGIPSGWMEGTALQSIARPLDFAMKRADPAVQQMLAQALLDPDFARQLMMIAQQQGGIMSPMLARSGPVAAPLLGGLMAPQN